VTVYVYRQRYYRMAGGGWAGGRFFAEWPWFDLTADTQDELHAFAARLGLRPEFLQPGPPRGSLLVSVSWHYNVTEGERARAIALGAKPVTRRAVSRIERQRAAALRFS
jgi:hypothetical protein